MIVERPILIFIAKKLENKTKDSITLVIISFFFNMIIPSREYGSSFSG